MLDNYPFNPFSHGQVESKIWLCEEVEKISKEFDTIYILGAWAGVMAFILHVRRNIKFKKLVTIDSNEQSIPLITEVLDAIKCSGNLDIQLGDCNKLEYSSLGNNLVINTSVENIVGSDWFTNIPPGTLVAVQSRTGGHIDNINPYESIKKLDTSFAMTVSKFSGSLSFAFYPVNPYNRYMKIGFK